jgi:putative membrane protein
MWSNYGYQPDMMGFGGGAGWMLLHGALSLLVLVAVIIAIVVLVRYLMRSETRHPVATGDGGRTSALSILDSRYARGEMDREEYLQKKKDLM